MTPESFIELVNIVSQIANKRNRAIAVFKLANTYYMVDASEWVNGRSYGQYVMTIEPGQNINQVFDIPELYNLLP